MAEEIGDAVSAPASVDGHGTVWQMRVDRWAAIADLARRLADPTGATPAHEDRERELGELFELVSPLEHYWAMPGPKRVAELRRLYAGRDYEALVVAVEPIARRMVGDSPPGERERPSFEVLLVADVAQAEADALAEELHRLRRREDPFTYELAVVPSLEDALVAVGLNFRLQACVIRAEFRLRSHVDQADLRRADLVDALHDDGLEELTVPERIRLLGERISELRPELDLYLVGHASIEALAGELGRLFDRVFLRRDALEMHLSILRGVGNRYQTPFFTALRDYSRQPTGVFHALPISRGRSVVNSPWVSDMVEFYGLNIFLAETSATSGGLDSLLDPVGPIKRAQELAARAFGAHRTYFVTNGTSTANKIVMQSIITPGETSWWTATATSPTTMR
jgi:arginine decarboxylase